MLEEQVAVGKSGQHTASIWVFLWSQLRGNERAVFTVLFLSQRKVRNTDYFTRTSDYVVELEQPFIMILTGLCYMKTNIRK